MRAGPFNKLPFCVKWPLRRAGKAGERIVHLLSMETSHDTLLRLMYLRLIRGDPEWREAYQQRKQQIARGVSRKPLSAHQAAWLFVCNLRKRKLATSLVATGAVAHRR
jgi:hypothetical protein